MSFTRARISLALALVLTALSALLAAVIYQGDPLPGDLRVARWLQAALPYGSNAGLLLAAASRLIWILALGLVLVFTLLRWWRALGFGVAVTVSGYALADGLVKRIVARPRPAADQIQLYRPDDGFSFPSATALAALVACGCGLYLWHTRQPARTRPLRYTVALLATMLVLVIGASRVYVGAHWPSDVVGAWLIGSAWLFWLIGDVRGGARGSVSGFGRRMSGSAPTRASG